MDALPEKTCSAISRLSPLPIVDDDLLEWIPSHISFSSPSPSPDSNPWGLYTALGSSPAAVLPDLAQNFPTPQSTTPFSPTPSLPSSPGTRLQDAPAAAGAATPPGGGCSLQLGPKQQLSAQPPPQAAPSQTQDQRHMPGLPFWPPNMLTPDAAGQAANDNNSGGLVLGPFATLPPFGASAAQQQFQGAGVWPLWQPGDSLTAAAAAARSANTCQACSSSSSSQRWQAPPALDALAAAAIAAAAAPAPAGPQAPPAMRYAPYNLGQGRSGPPEAAAAPAPAASWMNLDITQQLPPSKLQQLSSRRHLMAFSGRSSRSSSRSSIQRAPRPPGQQQQQLLPLQQGWSNRSSPATSGQAEQQLLLLPVLPRGRYATPSNNSSSGRSGRVQQQLLALQPNAAAGTRMQRSSSNSPCSCGPVQQQALANRTSGGSSSCCSNIMCMMHPSPSNNRPGMGSACQPAAATPLWGAELSMVEAAGAVPAGQSYSQVPQYACSLLQSSSVRAAATATAAASSAVGPAAAAAAAIAAQPAYAAQHAAAAAANLAGVAPSQQQQWPAAAAVATPTLPSVTFKPAIHTQHALGATRGSPGPTRVGRRAARSATDTPPGIGSSLKLQQSAAVIPAQAVPPPLARLVALLSSQPAAGGRSAAEASPPAGPEDAVADLQHQEEIKAAEHKLSQQHKTQARLKAALHSLQSSKTQLAARLADLQSQVSSMCCDNQQIAQDNAALKAQLGAVMQQRQQQQQQEQGSGQQGVYG